MRTWFLFFVFFFLFSCSPEAWKITKGNVKKTAQKAVFSAYVCAGVLAVKDSFPDTRIMLSYDSLSRSYFGFGKVSEVRIFPMPNNQYLLVRHIDWLKVANVVSNAGLQAIDKNVFAIDLLGGGNKSPRDTL